MLKLYVKSFEVDSEELDKISAYFAIQRLKSELSKGELYGENNFLIKGGYNTLINILSKNAKIILNSAVKTINYSSSKVKVTTSNNKFEADYIVNTAPLYILNKINFFPELPDSINNITKYIDMFDILKVNVIFDNKLKVSEVLINSKTDKFISWWQTHDGINHPQKDGWVLWITGPKAREFRAKSHFEISEFIKQQIDKFEKISPEILNVEIKDWNTEKFVGGAYSNLKPGAPVNTLAILRKDVEEKIFFAGEVYEIESATVHGAYMSGKRVAKTLNDYNI